MAKHEHSSKERGGPCVDAPAGHGGETHQQAASAETALTSNQGQPVSDDQNTLKAGERGPALLEDFLFREKLTHFDHERIPERVVHARGSGAHGYFEVYDSLEDLTRAAFLCRPGERTRTFTRFSTVAGSKGSKDTARDVRGFATKFYTSEGIFDLVGNNIPVFFIQDPIKFPDVIHAVKPEPDRMFPQAASAHDTFWDFVSLSPESTHMLLWVMSDRAIPRSFRMMEGFGVHTYRLVNAEGRSTFVKFHWRPALGSQSLLWDEAVKLGGADSDFHRRDLWEAIERGDFPEYELCLQTFDEDTADALPFDVLDPTKLIPEEVLPLRPVGKLVLDRNPVNFFAETEQVAFCVSHLVPGIDFSDDPLLLGRAFSYLDTQLIRLGGPNFHEIPINRSDAPVRNYQRDGHMRTTLQPGRVSYEPNSLDPRGPRETPTGFATYPNATAGPKLRMRAESFADHYSQARQFWRSMTAPEQFHIAGAFAFELSKVDSREVRRRMLGRLRLVDTELEERVAGMLGMNDEAEELEPARAAIDLAPSPALSLLGKAPETLRGRKVAALVSDGSDATLLSSLRSALKGEGAVLELVAPMRAGVIDNDGGEIAVDHTVSGGPSILFDAVVLAPTREGVEALLGEAAAVQWVMDAYAHLKVIGFEPAAVPLIERAHAIQDAGVVALTGRGAAFAEFIAAAKRGRVWDREAKVRSTS